MINSVLDFRPFYLKGISNDFVSYKNIGVKNIDGEYIFMVKLNNEFYPIETINTISDFINLMKYHLV